MQVPATEKPTLFAVHIYARGHWNAPVLQCSGLKKLPTSVAFCPVLFALRQPVVVEGKDISERLTGDDRTEEVAHPVFCLPYVRTLSSSTTQKAVHDQLLALPEFTTLKSPMSLGVRTHPT
jgi:hypothetical protein